MNDLERARALIDELGTSYHAAKIFNQRMAAAGLRYRMPVSTMQEMYAVGKGKPGMVALVCVVLQDLFGENTGKDGGKTFPEIS